MKKALSIVYLHQCVLSDEFKYLHRFFHSGSYKDGIPAFLCKNIGSSSHYFSLTIVGADDLHNRKIQIQHTYVIAIVEIAALDDQFGFVGQETSPVKST